jgi:hypothetical protein
MSTSTANWASSVSHHLRVTKKILQDTVFNPKYVWIREILRIGGADSRGCSAAKALNETEVGPTDEVDSWMVAHMYHVLG